MVFVWVLNVSLFFSMFISVCFVLTICSFVAGYFYTFCCRIFLANFQSSVASSRFFFKNSHAETTGNLPCKVHSAGWHINTLSHLIRLSFNKKNMILLRVGSFFPRKLIECSVIGQTIEQKKNNNNTFDVMYESLNWARVPILWQWKSFLHFNWQVPKTNQIKHVFSYSKPTVICIPNALFHIPNVQYISFVYVFEFILWMEKNEKYLLFHTLSQNNNSLKPPLLSAQNLWMNGKKG